MKAMGESILKGYCLGSTIAIPKPVFSLDQLGQHSLALKSMFSFNHSDYWFCAMLSHRYSHDIPDIPGEILRITRVIETAITSCLSSCRLLLTSSMWRDKKLNILGKTPQIQCYSHCVSYSPREKYGYFNDFYI